MLNFPELKAVLDQEDYLQDLPHCIFDIIFVPYIFELCLNGSQKLLVKLGVFLEQMACCNDEKVKELLSVSVLEPLILDEKNVVPILQKFLGEKTQKELNYWQQKYKT